MFDKKAFALLVLALAALAIAGCGADPHRWSDSERAALSTLYLANLPELHADLSNAVADDPRAVSLGHRLFFDTRFSANGAVSCGTCHLPEAQFQDGLALARGVGTTTRRTMPIAGTAYSPWLFWDGRKDSQWAQATGPLESAVEHAGNRTMYAHLLAKYYRSEYEELFGPLPDLADTGRFPSSAGPVDDPVIRTAWEGMAEADRQAISRTYANIGKSIAAYERRIMPGPARFDRYVEAVLAGDERAAAQTFTPDEVAGLRLFIGEGSCINCHNGPL
jgi:cytochrome c peroxidase